MSLLVWLPLVRDNTNQGLLDLTPTDLGTVSYINGGKIGKCLSAGDGTSSTQANGLSYNSNLIDELGTKFSCAVWVKPLGNHLHYDGAIISSGNWNAQHWSFGLSQDNSKVSVFGNGHSRYITCAVPTNTWTHLCCTSDGGVTKLYKNGEYIGQTTLSTLASDATNFTVGRETYASGYFSFNGNLNDVRIYNHVLSLKEIKELAKGLVCHYPLNGNGRGLPNLLTEAFWTFSNSGFNIKNVVNCTIKPVVNTDTSITFTGGGTGGSGNTQCYTSNLGHHITVSPDTTYKLSMKCTAVGTVTFRIYWYEYNGSSLLSTTSQAYTFTDGETKTITFTRTTGSTCNNFYMELNLYNQPTTSTFTILPKSLKLEVGDTATIWMPNEADTLYSQLGYDSTTEYDVSGYNYHGTRNNTFTWDSNAVRYSVSTVFNGSDNSIQIPFCQALGLTASGKTDYTWACWIYVSTLSSKGYATILGGQSGFEAETKYNSDGTPKLWAYSWGSNSYSYNLNEWVHIAATQTSTESKWYINGELAFTGSSTNIPYGNFFIGSWRDTNSQNFKGNVSDFRIYATALSADDIKELYQTSASIDNKGNMFAYEFSEPKDDELLTVPFTNSYGEHDSSNQYTIRNTDGNYYFEGEMVSAGSEYIKVNPTGKTYYYDTSVSIEAGNQFYIGFHRYDANKTARSNNACVYIVATKPSTDLVRYRFRGTIDLLTDGVNPCDTISIRVLNGWSGSTSSSTKKATIHYLSLREVNALETTSISKQGIAKTDMLLESDLTDIEKSGTINMKQFIER